MRKRMYVTMMKKGGVGKSTITSWFHQFLISKGKDVAGYDTDSSVETYASYKSLDVTNIHVITESIINKREYDKLVRGLIAADEKTVSLVDTGGSSFDTFIHYIVENRLVEVLEGEGIDTIFNLILVGGSDYKDTIKGLEYVMKATNQDAYVWLNQHYGKMPEGRLAPEKLLTSAFKGRIKGIVDLPARDKETFGYDVGDMCTRRLTFDEYQQSDAEFMAKARMRILRGDVFERMGEVFDE